MAVPATFAFEDRGYEKEEFVGAGFEGGEGLAVPYGGGCGETAAAAAARGSNRSRLNLHNRCFHWRCGGQNRRGGRTCGRRRGAFHTSSIRSGCRVGRWRSNRRLGRRRRGKRRGPQGSGGGGHVHGCGLVSGPARWDRVPCRYPV